MSGGPKRGHFTFGAKAKRGHTHIETAYAHKARHERNCGMPVSVYLCGYCSRYHVGRDTGYLEALRRQRSRDEALAGMVVGALTKLLDPGRLEPHVSVRGPSHKERRLQT